MQRVTSISRLGAIAVCSALACWGQTGSIGGEVWDRDGRPLPNAVIRIDRTDIAQQFKVSTDKSGHYAMAGLLLGDYQVTLEVGGKDERARSIRVRQPNENLTLDFSLEGSR